MTGMRPANGEGGHVQASVNKETPKDKEKILSTAGKFIHESFIEMVHRRKNDGNEDLFRE